MSPCSTSRTHPMFPDRREASRLRYDFDKECHGLRLSGAGRSRSRAQPEPALYQHHDLLHRQDMQPDEGPVLFRLPIRQTEHEVLARARNVQGPEQPVPDHQCQSKVPVPVLPRNTVVELVIVGAKEDAVQPAPVRDLQMGVANEIHHQNGIPQEVDIESEDRQLDRIKCEEQPCPICQARGSSIPPAVHDLVDRMYRSFVTPTITSAEWWTLCSSHMNGTRCCSR